MSVYYLTTSLKKDELTYLLTTVIPKVKVRNLSFLNVFAHREFLKSLLFQITSLRVHNQEKVTKKSVIYQYAVPVSYNGALPTDHKFSFRAKNRANDFREQFNFNDPMANKSWQLVRVYIMLDFVPLTNFGLPALSVSIQVESW